MGEKKAVLDLDPATERAGSRLLVKRKEGTDARKLGPSRCGSAWTVHAASVAAGR